MTGAIILGSTFGIEVESLDDPYVVVAEEALHSMAMTGNMGSYMGAYAVQLSISCYRRLLYSVDQLPWLRFLPTWMPGTQFKRDATAWRKAVDIMYDKPLQFVKQSIVRCPHYDCILSSHDCVRIGYRNRNLFHSSLNADGPR